MIPHLLHWTLTDYRELLKDLKNGKITPNSDIIPDLAYIPGWRLTKKYQQIFSNFMIAIKTRGKRRQYALYRLWRYLDFDKESIAYIMREITNEHCFYEISYLSEIFGKIFYKHCMASKSCDLKPFLPKVRKR